jgi:hypothetical protein
MKARKPQPQKRAPKPKPSSRGNSMPKTFPPRPSPVGDPDSPGATWVPLDGRYSWPLPKRWT